MTTDSSHQLGHSVDKTFDEKKEILVTEAARAFLEIGFTKTSMDALALRLGVSKKALYYYVSSKDEIVRIILEHTEEELHETIRQMAGFEGSVLERIAQQTLFGQTRANRHYRRFLVNAEPNSMNKENQTLLYHILERNLRYGIRYIRAGIRDGSIRKLNARVGATMVTALINAIPSHSPRDNEIERLKFIENAIEFIVAALRPERRSDQPS